MYVREIREKELIHRFLSRDPIAGAYHLGDLDPAYYPHCRWWGALTDGGDLESVLLLYTGLRTPAVLTVGSPRAIEATLEQTEAHLPAHFYGHLMADHVAVFQKRYDVTGLRPMVRMGLRRADFRRPDEDLSSVHPVTHAHTAGLVALYAYYPDNFFEPYQLEGGHYYGITVGDQLISVAGVHVFSADRGIAALGNIVTHPAHRSCGHSRRCTSRLLEDLFAHVPLVALNVQKDNAAAQRVYRRLGFVDHMEYQEGAVARRGG